MSTVAANDGPETTAIKAEVDLRSHGAGPPDGVTNAGRPEISRASFLLWDGCAARAGSHRGNQPALMVAWPSKAGHAWKSAATSPTPPDSRQSFGYMLLEPSRKRSRMKLSVCTGVGPLRTEYSLRHSRRPHHRRPASWLNVSARKTPQPLGRRSSVRAACCTSPCRNPRSPAPIHGHLHSTTLRRIAIRF